MKTFNVKFWLKPSRKRGENDLRILYVRVTVDGIRTEISLNRKVLMTNWDTLRGIPIGKTTSDRELHRYIRTVEDKLNQLERELIERGHSVTAMNMRIAFQGELEYSKSLLELFEKHNEDFLLLVEARKRSYGTYERYAATKNHLILFLHKKKKRRDVSFAELNYSFISNFELYLKTEAGLANNTTVKYIRNLRKIVKLAIVNDIIVKDPFVHWVGRLEERRKEFLWPEEIDRIQLKLIPNERLCLVRDLFIFACYTGYSYKDIKFFTPDVVQTDNKGRRWIFTNRQKTGIRSDVPLLPPALRILEKYSNHPICKERGTLLPVYSNQKLNNYLKEIATICEIKKSLSFGMARHTFATSIALLNGVSIESTSAMLGHTSTKQTRHYARILNLTVGNEMEKLHDKFT
jgi:integrase